MFTREEDAGVTATFSVEAADQVYNQTNEFVYLGGNVNHDVDLSIEVDRRIRNARCSFRKCTLNRAPHASRCQVRAPPEAEGR